VSLALSLSIYIYILSPHLGIVKLLAVEDEPLLLGRDPLLVLDLGLHLKTAVGRMGSREG